MEILSKISVAERVNAKSVAGDVSSPVNGDIWYNSSVGKFRKFQGGITTDLDTTGGGGLTATFTNQAFTATASQTVFNIAGGYIPGLVNVFYNGAKLANSEFTATNGTTITLGFSAESGDIIDVNIFTNADITVSKTFTTITYSATPNWDFSTGYNKQITLTGNATLSITNDNDGDYGTLFVTQDATGGRVLTLPAGDNTTGITAQTTANSIVIYSYVKRGSVRFWNASNR